MQGADAEQLAQQVKGLLKDVWLAVEKAGADYSEPDLTGQQHIIMNLIIERPGISATDLAEALGVTKGAISQHLSVLEQRRYVWRRRSSEDGRKQILELGEEGKVYRSEQARFEKLATQELVSGMSTRELCDAVVSLGKLKTVLSAD